MTQSEVPRRTDPEFVGDAAAGALSIGAFERGRWRLRRTRHLWVLNRVCAFGDRRFAERASVEIAVPMP
jgi:hypothetical protein